MRDDLLPMLACPVCAEPLGRVDGGQVGCPNGHRFDEAKQGHLTLLPAKRRALTADTPEMVDARLRFLGRGHYAPVERALAAIVADATAPGIVLDVGSGPGTYLAHALDAAHVPDGRPVAAPDASAPAGSRPGPRLGVAPDALAPVGRQPTRRLGVALDLSAVAIRRAARAHERAGAVVGDVTERLPVIDGAAAVLLDVFAPRNQTEYARVLHADGVLAVVTPRAGHLAELAEATISVDPEKERRLHDSLTPSFALRSSEDLTWTMELSAEDVHDVVHMGPSHHHVAADTVFEPATVTAAVTVSTWTPTR
ncbi:putative RNA methyltransferase [Curtobacterium flaccumfaciens]|uniref:putative RNA methyltransferase n=1 Tax=Curtobacterium flaccumfaciens TaxID=2035 RepID=UPI003879599C